jgi:hypothetical protein
MMSLKLATVRTSATSVVKVTPDIGALKIEAQRGRSLIRVKNVRASHTRNLSS